MKTIAFITRSNKDLAIIVCREEKDGSFHKILRREYLFQDGISQEKTTIYVRKESYVNKQLRDISYSYKIDEYISNNLGEVPSFIRQRSKLWGTSPEELSKKYNLDWYARSEKTLLDQCTVLMQSYKLSMKGV